MLARLHVKPKIILSEKLNNLLHITESNTTTISIVFFLASVSWTPRLELSDQVKT